MENEVTSLYTQYKDVDTKYKKTFKTINWREKEIKVLTYISIKDKIDLVDIAIQKATINGMIHPFLLKQYYELNIVYLYTDIVFSQEDRADEDKLYDELYTSGLLNEIIKNMNAKEIQLLSSMLSDTCMAMKEYYKSVAGFVEAIVEYASTKLPLAVEQVSNFNPELIDKMQQAMSLIKPDDSAK